jgi:hypothetical protein
MKEIDEEKIARRGMPFLSTGHPSNSSSKSKMLNRQKGKHIQVKEEMVDFEDQDSPVPLCVSEDAMERTEKSSVQLT